MTEPTKQRTEQEQVRMHSHALVDDDEQVR